MGRFRGYRSSVVCGACACTLWIATACSGKVAGGNQQQSVGSGGRGGAQVAPVDGASDASGGAPSGGTGGNPRPDAAPDDAGQPDASSPGACGDFRLGVHDEHFIETQSYPTTSTPMGGIGYPVDGTYRVQLEYASNERKVLDLSVRIPVDQDASCMDINSYLPNYAVLVVDFFGQTVDAAYHRAVARNSGVGNATWISSTIDVPSGNVRVVFSGGGKDAWEPAFCNDYPDPLDGLEGPTEPFYIGDFCLRAVAP